MASNTGNVFSGVLEARSQNQGIQRATPFQSSRGESIPCLFWLLAAVSIPWLLTASFSLLHFHVASPFWAPPKLLSTHLPSFLHFSLQLLSFIPYQVLEPASPTPCIHSPAIHIIGCLWIFTVFEGWLLDANSDFSC